MRFAKVTAEGEYIPPPPANSKASYATMMFVRATIVTDSGKFLSMATTIAVRYCAVRRQTAPAGVQKETQASNIQPANAMGLCSKCLLHCQLKLNFLHINVQQY